MAGIIEYNTPNKVMQRYVGHAGQVLCKYSAIKPDIIKMLSKIKGARGAVPQIMCTGYLYVLVDSVDQAFLEEHADAWAPRSSARCSAQACGTEGRRFYGPFVCHARSVCRSVARHSRGEAAAGQDCAPLHGRFCAGNLSRHVPLAPASAKTERRVTKLKSGLPNRANFAGGKASRVQKRPENPPSRPCRSTWRRSKRTLTPLM